MIGEAVVQALKDAAYAVDWVLGVAASHGIQLVPPVRWGGWTGRKPEYSFQDVLILEKQSQ